MECSKGDNSMAASSLEIFSRQSLCFMSNLTAQVNLGIISSPEWMEWCLHGMTKGKSFDNLKSHTVMWVLYIDREISPFDFHCFHGSSFDVQEKKYFLTVI